jgi:hypothetical protein
MASRGRTTFEKRRKEMARKEKQRAKAERRALRKAAPPIPYDEQIEMPASPPEDIPPGAPEQV